MKSLLANAVPMNNLHQVAVYGTLREGCYNRKAHIPKAISLGTKTISGFRMYRKVINKKVGDLFPFAVPSKLKTAKIKVELLLLTSKELRRIQKLENQYLTSILQVEGYDKPFLMWVQDEEYLNSLGPSAVLLPGNWAIYAKKEKIL